MGNNRIAKNIKGNPAVLFLDKIYVFCCQETIKSEKNINNPFRNNHHIEYEHKGN